METTLSRYLERQLQLALEGESPPRWPSPEAEEMAQALKAVFSEGLDSRARERVLVRLGLASLSALLQRHRAAAILARSEVRYRSTGKPGNNFTSTEGGTP